MGLGLGVTLKDEADLLLGRERAVQRQHLVRDRVRVRVGVRG